MIKSCVTISLVAPLRDVGPWIYWDALQTSIPKAAGAGFDAVELFTASAEAVNRDELTGLLAENNIKLAAVGTGAGRVLHGLTLTSPDEAVRQKAAEYIGRMIDFGAVFAAPAIIGSMQGRIDKGTDRGRALEWLYSALGRLGGRAADGGVALILEPLNRYETNVVNTLQAGVEVIKACGSENITLLADFFHMNIEEKSIPRAILSAADGIGHVHFVDSNRRPAGFGHIDLSAAAAALRDINYEGYASAEALPHPDPDAAARQTMAAFRKAFGGKSK